MDTPSASAPAARSLGYLRSPWLWAFLAGAVTLTLIRPLLRFEPAPPPILWELPAYSLAAADRPAFGSAELEGKVYVASFFFTRCAAICPRLTQAMGELTRRYDRAGIAEIQLVSITVDPSHDTPEVLGSYAREHGVDSSRWKLLTGDPERIRALIVNGFKAPMGEASSTEGLVDIAHSGKLFLVDGRGAVRGHYDSDSAGLEELFHRSCQLLKHAS
jgi:protein SCO1/2